MWLFDIYFVQRIQKVNFLYLMYNIIADNRAGLFKSWLTLTLGSAEIQGAIYSLRKGE